MREAIYFCEGAEKQEAYAYVLSGRAGDRATDISFCLSGGISIVLCPNGEYGDNWTVV